MQPPGGSTTEGLIPTCTEETTETHADDINIKPWNEFIGDVSNNISSVVKDFSKILKKMIITFVRNCNSYICRQFIIFLL